MGCKAPIRCRLIASSVFVDTTNKIKEKGVWCYEEAESFIRAFVMAAHRAIKPSGCDNDIIWKKIERSKKAGGRWQQEEVGDALPASPH